MNFIQILNLFKIQNCSNLKKRKEKEKQIKKLLLDRPDNKAPMGGARLAPANVGRLGAPVVHNHMI
jgi:hypothetical protein